MTLSLHVGGACMKDTQEIKTLRKAIMDCDRPRIESAVNDCLAAGMSADNLLILIQKIMGEVGEMFEKGRIFLPQMLAIAKSVDNIASLVQKSIPENKGENRRIVSMGTVKGDVHDIGKNICTVMFAMNGYIVNDLGKDVPVDDFIDSVKEGASFCGMSSLMTTTMIVMKEVIDELHDQGLDVEVYTMVGGAPVPQSFADKIGADIYGETALETLAIMNRMEPKRRVSEFKVPSE